LLGVSGTDFEGAREVSGIAESRSGSALRSAKMKTLRRTGKINDGTSKLGPRELMPDARRIMKPKSATAPVSISPK